MSLLVGQPVVDYKLAVKNHDRLLAQFQKTPDFARSVSYYRANIGKVTSPEDLLNDRRLLTVALSAFQLESEVDAKGIIRKLLTEDPTDKKSLAQRMRDPRFLQFATAFSSLGSDGGAKIRDPGTVNSVLDAFQTNEFEKWLGNDDPAVRQALYFERKINDTIDLKNIHDLLGQFRKTPEFSNAVSDYRSSVANIHSVDDLIADEKTLSVVLSAFHLEGLADKPDTIRRLVTENASSKTSLAQTDSRYMAFAQAFGTLSWDGGAFLRSSRNVDAVISAFESSEFEKSLNAAGTATQKSTYGAAGATTIANLFAKFQQTPSVADAVDYYRSNIRSIYSADALLKDERLLNVALSAFQMESLKTSPDTLRKLLTQDPTAAGALAQTDSRYMAFAQAFAALRPGATGVSFRDTRSIDSVVQQFQTNEFDKSLDAKVTQAKTSDGSMTIYQLFSDTTLTAVTRTALNLPTEVGALDLDQQIAAFKRAGFDISKLQDSSYLGKFINRFLVNTGLQQTSSSDPSGLAMLFQRPDDGSGSGFVPTGINLLV